MRWEMWAGLYTTTPPLQAILGNCKNVSFMDLRGLHDYRSFLGMTSICNVGYVT